MKFPELVTSMRMNDIVLYSEDNSKRLDEAQAKDKKLEVKNAFGPRWRPPDDPA